MKFKTLFGSMMVLGLVSTGVIAAPNTLEADTKAKDAIAAPEDVQNKTTDMAYQSFWTSIIDRNQDNAYLVGDLSAGQIKFSGLAKIIDTVAINHHKTDLTNGDLSNTEELYVDASVNDFTALHLALAYGLDGTINYLDGSKNTDVYNAKKKLYISEAYAKMIFGNIFVKVGQQYINFGSTSHQSISTPLTQILSQTDQLAITLGMQDLNGLYGSVSVYKGADYGSHEKTTESDATKHNKNKIKGYAFDLGYALYTDGYSINVYADYISNMLDVNALNFRFSDAIGDGNIQATQKKVPAIALHGDMTMGPVKVSANFVSAISKFDPRDYGFYGTANKEKRLKPLAYGLEASYTFMKKQIVTLGFQRTKDAGGFNPYAGDHNMPKQRLSAAYTYQLSSNIAFSAEYDHDKQYSNSGAFKFANQPGFVGNGKIDNAILAKLIVNF